MDQLYENMYRLLASTPNQFVRYLYPHIHWESRMLGIVGPRGVGKTTLLLQHILNSDQTNESLFVFADSMYFSEHTLFDTAEAFSKNGGTFLYIDEVHKYEGWSRELKAIYDSFPHLHVRFTGSSVLDIEKGEADLSPSGTQVPPAGPLLPRVSRHAPQHQLRALHARGDTRPQGRNPRSRAPPFPFSENTSQAATTRLEAIPNSRSNSAR